MNYEDYQDYEEYFLIFSTLFEEVFSRPELKTEKFIELWYDVDMLMCREWLSGPFYHVDCIDNNEKEDKQMLLAQAAVMEKLAFMVYDIQKDRWKFIKKPYSSE